MLIQEVQRGQTNQLAAALAGRGGPAEHRWVFKNLSGWTWPEGMAVLTAAPIEAFRHSVLRSSLLWNWQRRVLLVATVNHDGAPVEIANVHLSAHDDDEWRRREATLVIERAPTAIVGGDFNDRPGHAAPTTMTDAGWHDAWEAVHGDVAAGGDRADGADRGATNWTDGDRQGRPPTQRLDYVFTPPSGWEIAAATVIGSDDLDRFAALSDHLPLLVELRRVAS